MPSEPPDTQLLCLNCFVDGDQPNQAFSVEVPKTKNISILRTHIKLEKAPHLDHVAASDLDLFLVSESFLIDDLASKQPPSNGTPLRPNKRLSSLFPGNLSDDDLHIWVKAPPAFDPTQLLSVNCFIIGDTQNQMFTVEVPTGKNVSILKDEIKKKKAHRLGHVDASELELWEVSFPIDGLVSKQPPTLGPSLRPHRLLSDLFNSGLDVSHIHIVARVPLTGSSAPRSSFPPSAYRDPIRPPEQLAQDRQRFCHQRKPDAPSNGGDPQKFHDAQQKDTHIPCNRPSGFSPTLPPTLLHPVFGKFIDDAENSKPTADDILFLLAFVAVMRDIYDQEHERKETVLKLFRKHGMDAKSTMIGKFTTDGDLSIGEFRLLIAEFKNEVGSKGAEPFFQAILYYLEATRTLASEYRNSVLPCIIVLIFGPYIAFAGAAWTDRPTVQMLSPAIPCHYHDTDIKMMDMLVRHLGALRCAIHSLQSYYHDFNGNIASSHNPFHPYPRSFTTRDGLVKHFKYISSMKGRNLFFGNVEDDKGVAICVKFVTRYCEQAHRFLAERGFAPGLYAVERLPGGQYMVVMDDVSNDYISLFNFIQDNPDLLSKDNEGTRNLFLQSVRDCLIQLHQAGLVHGDIRNTNIMVKIVGLDNLSFLLVDYDSSGEIPQVRYPLDLNISTVKRPEGATGGAIVEVEHDLEMLNYIWDY